MRMSIGLGLALAAATLAATPVPALEKTSARAIDRGDDWNASTSGTIRYYNNCTGWVWLWSLWREGERLGVNFTTCVGNPLLTRSWALTYSGVPAGYGFTGTIEVADLGCGTQLAAQPYRPPVYGDWNATDWGGLPIPAQFSINVIWGAPGSFTNRTILASDFPAAGPTGPAACGTCFPTTRVSNSRYYGVGGIYCPSGVTLSDGTCDIEWMIDVQVTCPFGVEDESWGKIKSLYR